MRILGFYARNNLRNCTNIVLFCNTTDDFDRNWIGTLIIVKEAAAGLS